MRTLHDSNIEAYVTYSRQRFVWEILKASPMGREHCGLFTGELH